MWLLPLGYGYVLQAGSMENDAIAAVFFLVSFILLMPSRGRQASSMDLALSLLAIGFTTGFKATNLVLGPPWLD
jgi:NhaP-type Na+/H+ or K+/H+ antiporter